MKMNEVVNRSLEIVEKLRNLFTMQICIIPEAKRSELRVVLLEPTSKNLFGSIEIIFTLDYYYFICLKSDTLQLPDLTSYI